MVVEDKAKKRYRLENFPDVAAAKKAGALLTHYGPCGLCSTLQDLAMYLGYLDLGSPVRQCAVRNFISPFESLVTCIEDLGFSGPCAQIWAYNARNTQKNCLEFCLTDTTYNLMDGSLGPCLDCDERVSGLVFKSMAGRTRRNSGIASAICRPCTDVKQVEHDYPF